MNEENPLPRVVSLHNFEVDLIHHVLRDESGVAVELRPQALDLLCLLASNAGKVMDKQELMRQVWQGVFVTDDSLVQAVGDIRRAMNDQGHQLIQTVPRRGYRLIEHKPNLSPRSAVAPASELTVARDLSYSEAPEPVDACAANAANLSAPEISSDVLHHVISAEKSPYVMRKPTRYKWSALVIGLILIGVVGGLLFVRSHSAAFLDAMRGKLPDRPALAVLAFKGFDISTEGNVLGIGFAEDLITELARNPDLVVLAPNTSFSVEGQGKTEREFAQMYRIRYIVEGSIRREGTLEIVNAQLIDGENDQHVWAQRFEFGAADVYRAQSDLVAKIAGSVLSEIRETEKTASLHRPPSNLDAYELTLRGLAHKHQLNKAGMIAGRAELIRALDIDPLYAPAHVYLGYLNAIDAGRGLSGVLTAKDQAAAEAEIRRGIELDPNLAVAYQALGVALAYQGRFDEELEAAKRSVALSPGDADNLNFLGYAQENLGLYDDASHNFSHAIDLNPVAPAYYLLHYAEVLYALKQYELAGKTATLCAQRAPGFPPCYTIGIAADMDRGATVDAHNRVASLLMHVPIVTANASVAPTMLKHMPNELAHFLDSLRTAGVPGEPDSSR